MCNLFLDERSPHGLIRSDFPDLAYFLRSEEHTSELQSQSNLVCRLLLEKKKYAFQSGRFFDGGSSDIGWATSTDNGANWTNGFFPCTTPYSNPPGTYARSSDPSVALDAC